ncbi:MAG: iron dicitrate transport regulator FecR, partial [Synechococcaceae cyanobacterium]|nr:iron dicitrate transport regulator FecR [Synechococcaceae cyanobacterium]
MAKPALAAVGLALAAWLVPAAAPAGPSPSATVREILDGDELFIEARRARPNEMARSPERVSTGASRGQLLFAQGAAGRLNRFSQLRLGTTCFVLSRGQILVSGRQDGCTPTARLKVTGTTYVLAVTGRGEAEVLVLEGVLRREPIRRGTAVG